jgi:hypothetical protein
VILSAVLAGSVVAGALVYVVRPLLRAPSATVTRRSNAGASRHLALLEERDRALAALQELEFDHRTGKVSDHDYRELIGQLRGRAIQTMRALQGREPPALRSRDAMQRAGLRIGG